MRILAILTPKGAVETRPKPVGAPLALGTALCDGGSTDWTGERPLLSEKRFAQLLAARGTQRTALLTRAARILAQTLPPERQINPANIAWAILNPDNTAPVARQYYRRLDTAARRTAEEETA